MMNNINWAVEDIEIRREFGGGADVVKAKMVGKILAGAPNGVEIANDLQKMFSRNDGVDAAAYAVVRARGIAYHAIRPVTGIKKVIFNDPATIVYWTDGSKTVVKAENEPFDREKGLAMAISKKSLGNQGNYFEVFKKYIKEDSDEDA